MNRTTEIGISLPSNVETAARRLVTEIKALDTWAEANRAKVPDNVFMAWKLWAKGTVDVLVAVLTKSAAQSAAFVFPLWPAGAVLAATTVAADKALDDTTIANEYIKLNVWRETFKAHGAPPPGPAPTPPPGMTPSSAGSPLIEALTKAALFTGGGLVAVFALSKVLGR